MARILVDTSAIYALVDHGDGHHSAAEAFYRRALERRDRLVLADLIFIEAVTLLKGRFGSYVSVRTGESMRESATYAWVPLLPDCEQDVWDIFRTHTDKAWSYTDCAILALARRLGISEVFAYDRHFDQMPGLVRVGD